MMADEMPDRILKRLGLSLRVGIAHMPYGPHGYMMAAGAWSFSHGVGMFATACGDYVVAPIYAPLAPIGLLPCGILLILHGLVSVVSMFLPHRMVQTMAALVGVPIWGTLGGLMALGAARDGLFVGSGIFGILLALGMAVSVMQFAREP